MSRSKNNIRKTKYKKMMDVENLPDLCLIKIFCFLDSKNLVSCVRVNKRWQKLITSTRRLRETLIESIDVFAEFKNLPLEKLTRAKVGTFEKLDEWVCPPSLHRNDFSLLQFSSRLTHLELDFNFRVRENVVQHLRNSITCLSLGPKVRRNRWVKFWKDNPRLEKLEIVSEDKLNLRYLPKTLKAFAAVNVWVVCLHPCSEVLEYLKISKRALGPMLSFDRLKKLILKWSDEMPKSAPVLEHFEYRDSLMYYYGRGDLVEKFVCTCHSTLTDLIAPGLNFYEPPHPFPNLKTLSVHSLKRYSGNFPALKSFTISGYNPNSSPEPFPFPDYSDNGRYSEPFPREVSGIENLSVREDYSYDIIPKSDRVYMKSLAERMIKCLNNLYRLKSFEIEKSDLVRHYLTSIPLSNLKRLRILDVKDHHLDLSELVVELDELKITTTRYHLTVTLPSAGLIRDLKLEGNLWFCGHGPLMKIERLEWNSFQMDYDFVRRCSRQGLSALRVDTGRWETTCPDSFFGMLQDSLFAVYASVHKDFREEFESKVKHFCPSLRICSFVCSADERQK